MKCHPPTYAQSRSDVALSAAVPMQPPQAVGSSLGETRAAALDSWEL
jgi:hypothetical protein